MEQLFSRIMEWLCNEVDRTTFRNVAHRTGLNARTIFDLYHGHMTNPTLKTLLRLEREMERS